jgi:hypothetical protein
MRWVVLVALVALGCGDDQEQTSFYDEAKAYVVEFPECGLVQFEPRAEGTRGQWILWYADRSIEWEDVQVQGPAIVEPAATSVLFADGEHTMERTETEEGVWFVGEWRGWCGAFDPVAPSGAPCGCTEHLVEHLYD